MNRARCRCGQLTVDCTGEPVRASVCHCLACKVRSGSAFAAQVRFPTEQVTISGRSSEYVHIADSGNAATFPSARSADRGFFTWPSRCPARSRPHSAIFEDPWFVAPNFSVYESRKLDWVDIVGRDRA